MKTFTQLAIGVGTAIAVSFVSILQSSFGEARHTLSIIGAIAIFITSLTPLDHDSLDRAIAVVGSNITGRLLHLACTSF